MYVSGMRPAAPNVQELPKLHCATERFSKDAIVEVVGGDPVDCHSSYLENFSAESLQRIQEEEMTYCCSNWKMWSGCARSFGSGVGRWLMTKVEIHYWSEPTTHWTSSPDLSSWTEYQLEFWRNSSSKSTSLHMVQSQRPLSIAQQSTSIGHLSELAWAFCHIWTCYEERYVAGIVLLSNSKISDKIQLKSTVSGCIEKTKAVFGSTLRNGHGWPFLRNCKHGRH